MKYCATTRKRVKIYRLIFVLTNTSTYIRSINTLGNFLISAYCKTIPKPYLHNEFCVVDSFWVRPVLHLTP